MLKLKLRYRLPFIGEASVEVVGVWDVVGDLIVVVTVFVVDFDVVVDGKVCVWLGPARPDFVVLGWKCGNCRPN